MADDVDEFPRRLEYVSVDDLRPDPRNAKRHVSLADSFDRFGYTAPIEIDERTGLLAGGHGRRESVLAARNAGDEPPEGVVVHGETWLVPVVRGWSSKDDADALAYLIAANRYVEKGGWDLPVLADQLVELQKATERALEGVGYDDTDVNLLLAEVARRNPTAPDEFRSFDENISTDHQCPRCGYSWSGG